MRHLHHASRPLVAVAAVAALVLAGCSSGSTAGPSAAPTDGGSTGGPQLQVQVASYDVAAAADQRIIVGLLTGDNVLVSYGEVSIQLARLGSADQQASASPEPGPRAVAEWIPVPGTDVPDEHPDAPTAAPAGAGPGVYQATVDIPRPGRWAVAVQVDLGDGPVQGSDQFIVRDRHLVPTVGDAAPRATNLTMDDVGDVPAAAVDSRAGDQAGGEVPDPQLHDSTIADDLAAGRPFLVLFSTPVYCISRFCGPITQHVADLEERFGDRVDVIHVEVWRDYDEAALNDAFDAWVNEQGNGHEPWTFLVDGDGTIVQRWDNVPDTAELRDGVQRLAG